MKKLLISLAFISFIAPCSFSQGSWVQKTSFTPGGRMQSGVFVINSNAYIVGGYLGMSLYTNDNLQYNPTADSWAPKAVMPVGSYGGVGFTAGTKGYYTTGVTMYGPLTELYQYNATGNYWSVTTSFPGMPRIGASGFGIGGSGYVGMGLDTLGNFLNDLWQLNTGTPSPTWIQKASLPGPPRAYAPAFVIGSKGYVLTGLNAGGLLTDLWEYDPSLDSWTQKSSLPGTGRSGSMSFALGNKGYIVCGNDLSNNQMNEFWEYDAVLDQWTQFPDFSGPARHLGVGFSVGAIGYISSGSSNAGMYNDLWAWVPWGVGIPEGNENTAMVYPNPGNGNIRLINECGFDETTNIRVSDPAGKLVYSCELKDLKHAREIALDLSFLSPGTYFINGRGIAQNFYRKLIVIK